MIQKASFSGLKYSPCTSPFQIKTMNMTGQLGLKTQSLQEISNLANNSSKFHQSSSMFSMSLLSPAPHEKHTPLSNFKIQKVSEGDLCNRRLFTSPSFNNHENYYQNSQQLKQSQLHQ